jgi:hypothetical protein
MKAACLACHHAYQMPMVPASPAAVFQQMLEALSPPLKPHQEFA